MLPQLRWLVSLTVVFSMEITISFMQRSIQLSSAYAITMARFPRRRLAYAITMARFSRRRPFDGQYDKPRCEVFPVH